MREGTPSGFSTMSTGVPSSRYGMSSTGMIVRDDALVAVTAGHLVARLHAALHRQVHLDHLQHARREIVARGDLGALLLEALLELLALLLDALRRRLELRVRLLVLQTDLEPLLARQGFEIRLRRSSSPLFSLFGPPAATLPSSRSAHALEQVVLEDALLVVEVLADPLQLGASRSTARGCPSRRRRA